MAGSFPGCCARAPTGHATTVLLKSLMNSRRLMASPAPRTTSGSKDYHIFGPRIVPFVAPRHRNHVRFGSKADIGTHSRNVRFVPKADIQPDQASRDEVTTAEQKPRQHTPRSLR